MATVFVIGLKGKSHVIPIKDGFEKTSVAIFKKTIHEKLRIEPEDQRLLFQIKELQTNDPKLPFLSSYGICINSTITLILRLPGGFVI